MSVSSRSFWRYLGRFVVVHVVIYTLTAVVFLTVQDGLPASTQSALEIFVPYYPIGVIVASGQMLRSVILALVLYPFYDAIVRSDRGLLILFGALWGIALVGSVAPMPGSIEGVIYTEIPLITHLIVLATSALEVLLFSLIFLWWEEWSRTEIRRGKEVS